MVKARTPVQLKVNSMAVWNYLTRRNLAQNELAGQLGISTGYMAQLISGKRSPSPALRRRMLDTLAPLSFDDLFLVSERDAL